jgi:hypothetical protein
MHHGCGLKRINYTSSTILDFRIFGSKTRDTPGQIALLRAQPLDPRQRRYGDRELGLGVRATVTVYTTI